MAIEALAKMRGLPDQSARGLVVATKAATVAVQTMEPPMHDHDAFEPDHASSPTDHIIEGLQLYGYRPAEGEADLRTPPE
ncbi:MAG: hypothetical protein ACKVPY_09030, partial [Paracoccaceae bacterium]